MNPTCPLFRTFLLLTLLVVAGGSEVVAQENITLRLRTMLNYYPVACDSIEVQNTTQGTSTTLYYPDTILTNSYVGIEESVSEKCVMGLTLLSANPFSERAELLLSLPESGQVEMTLTNMLGQQEYRRILNLHEGQHRLLVRAGGNGLHVLTVRTSTDRCSAKLIQNGEVDGKTSIEYLGIENSNLPIKRVLPTRSQFDFAVGDYLTLTTYANARYYDTVTPIQQTIGLTVTESGTVNFKTSRNFETDSVLRNDSIDLRNTIWDVVGSYLFNFYSCLNPFATDMGEEVESQVTFYDSTFCSIRRAGICDAEYYAEQYHAGCAWNFNYYPSQQVYYGKYRVEYDEYPEYNTISTNLYVGPMDSLCSNLTYHYEISYLFDYNILIFHNATTDPNLSYVCYFRREGERIELPVSDTYFSGCLGKGTRSDSVIFLYENGLLDVHHNLTLNCAASNVIVHPVIYNNTIDITYLVDDNISANCICSTELDYMIQDLPSGTYNVIIRLDNQIIYQQYHSF